MDRLGDLGGGGGGDHNDENSGLVPGAADHASGGRPAFMTKFFALVTVIKNQMSLLRQNIKELDDMHKLSFGDNVKNRTDLKALENKVEQKTAETQNVARVLGQALTKMKSDNDEYAKSPDATGSEIQIRNNMQTTLTRKFTEDVQYFQDIQSSYKAKMKENVERQVKIVKPNATAEEVEAAMDGETDIFAQAVVNAGPKHAAAKAALEAIQDKHRDILKLEKSIIELQQLFNDMAVLVDQQSELIDQIEHTVNETLTHVEKGVDNLQKANKMQKASRRKMCCIIGLFLGIGAMVAAPIFIARNRDNPNR